MVLVCIQWNNAQWPITGKLVQEISMTCSLIIKWKKNTKHLQGCAYFALILEKKICTYCCSGFVKIIRNIQFWGLCQSMWHLGQLLAWFLRKRKRIAFVYEDASCCRDGASINFGCRRLQKAAVQGGLRRVLEEQATCNNSPWTAAFCSSRQEPTQFYASAI